MTDPVIEIDALSVVRGRRVLLAIDRLSVSAGEVLGGFLISAATDLPTGAMIVILSSLFVGAAALAARLARRSQCRLQAA